MQLHKDGISYYTKTQAVFYSDPGKVTTPPDATLIQSSDWSPWGCNNDEPKQIACDIENCSVLSGGIESITRLAAGRSLDAYLMLNKAPDGTEDLEWVSDTEVLDFLEANEHLRQSYLNLYNAIAYGWGATQFLLSADRGKINRIQTTDISNARLQKRNPSTGLMNNIYLCSDWQVVSNGSDKIKKVPLLEEGWEHEQLQSTKTGYEFAMLHRLLKNGRAYYPTPLHRSAKAWVAIARSVPNIKAAMNKNQLLIKYVILISDTYWTRIHKTWDSYKAEEREKIIKETHDSINNWLTGELNAGKSIIAGKVFDPISNKFVDDITINVVDDAFKDGKMLPDSAAANKEILFSMFANPAIFGGNLLADGTSGGSGSGSDIREATLVLLELLHPERTNNLRIYNLIKNYNGWSKRLEIARSVFAVTDAAPNNQRTKSITPRLVFRYSSAVLTTLDTGKSSKPLTT